VMTIYLSIPTAAEKVQSILTVCAPGVAGWKHPTLNV